MNANLTWTKHADGVEVTFTDHILGQHKTMVLPFTVARFEIRHALWQEGMLIQNAFPELDADQREFLITGMSAAEWDNLFGEEEE